MGHLQVSRYIYTMMFWCNLQSQPLELVKNVRSQLTVSSLTSKNVVTSGMFSKQCLEVNIATHLLER